ncbi:MAG: hypothetical protein ACKVWV_01345 [Planctomycetota bacterium]
MTTTKDSQRLPPQFIELIHSAVLAAFWRRKALHHFLRRCGVSDRTLAQWDESMSKREWLDLLFPRLEERADGQMILRRMAEALGAMTTFPDLSGWQDAQLKIENASQAVTALKRYLDAEVDDAAREKARQESRERARQLQEESARSRASLEKLSARLNDLSLRIGSQEAGYAFQDWFYDLMDYFEILNRRPYVHDGRQHDGAVTLEGTTYIVELKFTTEQSGAGVIDSLLVKVNDKADNTMGICLSMSGFSSTAKKQASGKKTPLLLMDAGHVYLALSGSRAFADLVVRCRRHVSETSEAYVEAAKLS